VALGVFDILHVGHINYLEAAAKQAGVLLVGLENDAAVRLNKGPGRPVNTLQERMLAVAALSCVDLVFGFEDAPDYTDPDSFHMYVKRYATLKATIAIPDVNPELTSLKMRQVVVADTICQDEGYGAVDAIIISGLHPNSTTRMLNEVGY
jgi:cytidyltransferase-like protein